MHLDRDASIVCVDRSNMICSVNLVWIHSIFFLLSWIYYGQAWQTSLIWKCTLHFSLNESTLNYFVFHSALTKWTAIPFQSLFRKFQSRNAWGWRGPLQTVQSTTLLNQAGSPGAGCPGPCPLVFSVSPRMEMPQHLWATCTKSLAISAEVAKEMFGVGLSYICKILNSSSFNYLNSIPWNRTCNLARKDLMTRLNPAVLVKIKI